MNQTFNFHEMKTSNRLPSPSGTALEIMKLLQRDDAEISDVIKLVKLDPALTGRVLQFANSAAAGSHRSVTNIADAVMMMGMSAVKNFALSLSLVGNNNDNRCPNFNYAAYWSKSLATGVAISVLSTHERVISAEEAFTLGLLLCIGRLALATAWSESYGECIALAKNDDAALLKLEQERFAITHRELSVMLLADWGFSDLFLEGLKLSYAPLNENLSKANSLAKQLVFAGKVANYCLADEAYRAILKPDLVVEASHNSFDEAELGAFLEVVLTQWQEWGKSINVKTDIRQSSPELGEGKNILSGLNILVVDDDDLMMLARLSKQLTAAGHKVAACKDGDSALKYALEHKPDLIITNWHMKPMDGIQLSKTLHSSTWGSSIYIIMLTSTEEESALIEAFNAGIDDYVTTPISLKVLLARIRAGQRIITLQQEVEKERKDLQRYIAELAVANRRLELMANTDVLTGLSNRRYSLNRLEQEWTSAQRNKRPISVLMLDLDHFKSVNDTFGHDAGDLVLIQAAKVIKKCVRATDIPCRLGGEEFLVILPSTDGKEALLLAERIRKMIEANQANVPLTKPMTVSIGAACSTNGKISGKELITLADEALYAVKREKRNAVKLA